MYLIHSRLFYEQNDSIISYNLTFTVPQDYNPVLFDFFNLSGGAVGDKQLSSYSDMFTFSQGYHGYIDVNFLMTGMSIYVLMYISAFKVVCMCNT
jgi:hypothetical protein